MFPFLNNPAERLYANCPRLQFLPKCLATAPVTDACSVLATSYSLILQAIQWAQDRNLSLLHKKFSTCEPADMHKTNLEGHNTFIIPLESIADSLLHFSTEFFSFIHIPRSVVL